MNPLFSLTGTAQLADPSRSAISLVMLVFWAAALFRGKRLRFPQLGGGLMQAALHGVNIAPTAEEGNKK